MVCRYSLDKVSADTDTLGYLNVDKIVSGYILGLSDIN